MQDRWYNPPVEQDRAMVLAEIDAKRPVRIASNDNIGFDVPLQNNMLLASAEIPNKVTTNAIKQNVKLQPKYDTTTYNVKEYKGQSSRVKLLTVDASSDFNTVLRGAGHSLLAVDGIVYNMSPDGYHKINLEDYLHSVTNQGGNKPSQSIFIHDIRVSEKEANNIKNQLSKQQGKYDPLKNNCSTVAKRALDKGLDKPLKSDWFEDNIAQTPLDLFYQVFYSDRITKYTRVTPKKR